MMPQAAAGRCYVGAWGTQLHAPDQHAACTVYVCAVLATAQYTTCMASLTSVICGVGTVPTTELSTTELLQL